MHKKTKIFIACAKAAGVPQQFISAWAKYMDQLQMHEEGRSEVMAVMRQLTELFGLEKALTIPMPADWQTPHLESSDPNAMAEDLKQRTIVLDAWLVDHAPCEKCQEGLMCAECRGD